MERLRYLDFELKIERAEEQYRAHVLRSPAGEASGMFTLPFSKDKLENLILKLSNNVRHLRTRRLHSEEMKSAIELGSKLFDAVFSHEIRACLRVSLSQARQLESTGLRLKLRLQEVSELAGLPWEYLYDSQLKRFFAQSNQTPIVRYIEMNEAISPLTVPLPLKVLVLIASPSDYVSLDVMQEKSLLQQALAPLLDTGRVVVEWLEHARLLELQRRLSKGTYHILHFIGHGGFDAKTGEGVLVFEDEQGRGRWVEAQRLGTLLHDHPRLRLVLLNSCEGARNARTDPFASVAASLIQQGVPAVIAMQFEITDGAALILASEFYAALAEGYPVDGALAEARKAIYAQPNDVEWGTPVLYLRAEDGVLFHVTQTAATEKATEKTESSLPQTKAAAPEAAPAVASEAKRAARPVFIEVFKGEMNEVNSVAFSPDGRLLASGTGGWPEDDNTIRLWRVADGELIRTLAGHTGPVSSVAFSPDGAMLASGSGDSTVRLWRVADGELIRTLAGHTGPVSSVAFSPDGAMLALGSLDKTVRLWRVADGGLIRTLTGHTEWVCSVAFSPDGRMLASGSLDKTVRLWQVADGGLTRTLTGHELWVSSVAFSPDGTMLASGSLDKTVRLWRVAGGQPIRMLTVHTEWVRSVAFSPDGTMLASGSVDKTVRLWQVADGGLTRTLTGHELWVNSVTFSPDGSLLASGSGDKTVRLYFVGDIDEASSG